MAYLIGLAVAGLGAALAIGATLQRRRRRGLVLKRLGLATSKADKLWRGIGGL